VVFVRRFCWSYAERVGVLLVGNCVTIIHRFCWSLGHPDMGSCGIGRQCCVMLVRIPLKGIMWLLTVGCNGCCIGVPLVGGGVIVGDYEVLLKSRRVRNG
jgi:hypothetical protein